MEVILLEHVEKLGKMGDKVTLKTVMLVTTSSLKTKLCAQPKLTLLILKNKKQN